MNLYYKLYRYFKKVPHREVLKKKYLLKLFTSSINNQLTVMEHIVIDYCHGYSIERIAGTAGFSPERVKSYLRRAETFKNE